MVIPTFLGMNVLVVLSFMLWLHMGIALALAQVIGHRAGHPRSSAAGRLHQEEATAWLAGCQRLGLDEQPPFERRRANRV